MKSFKLDDETAKVYVELNEIIAMFKIFNIIKASLKLNIYDSLKVEKTLEEISAEFDIKTTKLEPFLKILCEMNYLIFKNNRYCNSEMSNFFLTNDAICSMKDYFLTQTRFSNIWFNLDESLKKDEIIEDKDFFVDVVNGMAFECLFGELYETINIISRYPQFKNAKTLLDVGGGHGLYSIAMEKINPNLEAFVFDLEPVLENTKKFIDKFDSNVKTISGDFNKDDFNGNFDIIFSSYNPGGKNPKIAKKIYDSLNVNGLFIAKQCFNNEKNKSKDNLKDNIGKLEWNLTHLNKDNIKNENIYSFKCDLNLKEYQKYLVDLGFTILDVFPEKRLSKKVVKGCNAYMIIAIKSM